MRSPLILLLISLLVVGCGQKETPPVASAPTQTKPSHPLDNDYGNPNLKAGNPSKATQDTASADNYLILKPQYVLSYNRSRNIANWASWELNKLWMGNAKRQNNFRPDSSLPKGWYQVVPNDYNGSGFDRGHLVNSQDRSRSVEDNSATFLMTNIVPQAPDNNQVAWEKLESYSRDLANQGKELYIVAGGSGTGGEGKNGTANSLRNNVTVPAKMWKVILVLDDPTKGLAGVNANSRAIAVIMPNKQGRNHKWQDFCATVDDVQKLTGYNFFTNVAPEIRAKIDAKKNC
jgi:endonuclease G